VDHHLAATPVTAPEMLIRVGDFDAPVSDVMQAIGWLKATMGDHSVFHRSFTGLSAPLDAWSLTQHYKDVKRDPRIPGKSGKEKIRYYLLQCLADAEDGQVMEDAARTATAGGQGFKPDQAERKAIEELAMEAARKHYADDDWLENDADTEACKSNPFDLILRRNGEIKHVEAKGTTGAGITVILTEGEVKHVRDGCEATEPCHTVALFILTGIEIAKGADGKPKATGGHKQVHDPWHLTDGLQAKTYSYLVPLTALASTAQAD
jgi:hypothetical protein